MLRRLFLILLFSFLSRQSCVGNRIASPGELNWQAWLLVDPESPKPANEGTKTRRITPKSVFIAPAFSGSSLPDCAEGYRPDSMGRCVKLVQLNHAAQLEFLLQRLNAMYAAPVVQSDIDDLSTSDSNSSGPLQVTIPIDIPPESEEETKDSVEVAVVMADVLKDDEVKQEDKKDESDASQTIVAVWNVGKNGSSVEEIEKSEISESEHMHQENSEMILAISNATKYEIVSDNEATTTPKSIISLVEEETLLPTAPPTSIHTSETNNQNVPETKEHGTAMGLLEEVGEISSEILRSGNPSRRNVSNDQENNDVTTMINELPSTTETQLHRQQIIEHSPVTENNQTLNVSESEIQVTSDSKQNTVRTSTSRPHSFVRFPTDNIDNAGSNGHVALTNRYNAESVRQNFVKFPDTHPTYSNQEHLIPNNVQQRETFWWLPPGWRLDPTRHQPMLVRFWARMPLIRDPGYHPSMTVENHNQDIYSQRRRRPLVY